MLRILIVLTLFAVIQGEENRPSIELNEIKFILPTNIDRDIESVNIPKKVIGCKNGKGQSAYTFSFEIMMFSPKIYKDVPNYVREMTRINESNRMTCVLFDYFKEITKDRQAWLSESPLYPKENFKETYDKTEYHVVHRVYCDLDNIGVSIGIIQQFKRDDVRSRDMNEKLLNECLRSTKYKNQDFLVMPKFLMNKWAMIQMTR